MPNLGFKLLSEEEQAKVDAAARQFLNSEGLNDEARSLSLAHLYQKQGLRFEAIQALEAALEKGSQNPALYQKLGQLYRQVELTQRAEQAYLKALEWVASDAEWRAPLSEELGDLYAALKETQTAIAYLQQAIADYQTLGETQRAAELQNQLVRLKTLLETGNL